jgi:hypothetical protein
MGKYLDLLAEAGLCERNEFGERSYTDSCGAAPTHNPPDTFVRKIRLFRTFSALEARCPDGVPTARWKQAVADGQRFLGRWGAQAEALGWTPKDLFGLLPVPDRAATWFDRLSRYDATGLVWLLRGRPVVALTEATAAIENSKTGDITVYRRFNKPELGPLGDSLDDM